MEERRARASGLGALAAALSSLSPAACSLAPEPSPSAYVVPLAPEVLQVDASTPLATISPLVFGTNVGPWQSLTPSMMPDIQAAGFTFLRFPGGNWGDEYRLFEHHVDDFVALARALNAEPMIHVRLFRAQPESAAAWVRYANLERGYTIRYWAIGNEPSLYATRRGAVDYDTAAFNQDWREFALAMKAVDPSILLLGPEIHQYTGEPGQDPQDEHGRDWMAEFLSYNGDLVDIVSFHRYPFGPEAPSPQDLLASSAEWDRIIPHLRAQIAARLGADRPIAVTEVNSNWSNLQGGETTPDSFYNALWWADVLGRLITQQVEIVAHFALADAGGLGVLDGSSPRPTYYVYPLFRRFGRVLLASHSDDPSLRLYAARRDDGALTLLLINLAPTDTEKHVHLLGFTPQEQAEAYRLDRNHHAERIEPLPVGTTFAILLPGESVTLLILSPE